MKSNWRRLGLLIVVVLALEQLLTGIAQAIVNDGKGTGADPSIGQSMGAPIALRRAVVASGGGTCRASSRGLSLTTGQLATGQCESPNVHMSGGFWQNPPESGGCCLYLVGNVDCSPDDGVDIGDLTALINNLFITFTPLCCPSEANCDGDAADNIDIGDLTALINNLFLTFTPLPNCR